MGIGGNKTITIKGGEQATILGWAEGDYQEFEIWHCVVRTSAGDRSLCQARRKTTGPVSEHAQGYACGSCMRILRNRLGPMSI